MITMSDYTLLVGFGVICIAIAYTFGWCFGYKRCDKETQQWLNHMVEQHNKENEKRIEDMYAEHLAREEKMNEDIQG